MLYHNEITKLRFYSFSITAHKWMIHALYYWRQLPHISTRDFCLSLVSRWLIPQSLQSFLICSTQRCEVQVLHLTEDIIKTFLPLITPVFPHTPILGPFHILVQWKILPLSCTVMQDTWIVSILVLTVGRTEAFHTIMLRGEKFLPSCTMSETRVLHHHIVSWKLLSSLQIGQEVVPSKQAHFTLLL